MPIQLTWQPNQTPPIANVVNIGLELSGEDASLSAVTDGRVKLVEVPSTGRGKGQAENTTERLIATFHGKFHSNAAAARARRITFEIFIGSSTIPANSQDAQGFDPECIFGVDAFVFTFVNREFVVWLPFNVDTRSEGSFLEIQAVAEVGTGTSVKELGRSMVLNLGIERTHAVDTTSTANNAAIAYTGRLVGNLILSHEDYILPGGVPNRAQSTPTNIVLDSAFIPVTPGGTVVPFAPYPAGTMRIILLMDLLDGLVPPDSFLASSIKGGIVPAQVRTASVLRFRNSIQQGVQAVFTDAGFTGVQVLWQDQPAAAALVSAFTGAFMFQTLGGHFWRLSNSARPFVTSFWNFFIGSSDSNNTAGVDEGLDSTTATPRTIGTQQVFLPNTVPIGSGTKRVNRTIQIATATFQDLLMQRSGVARTYANLAEFNDAVDKVAGKMIILFAHEVAHSLGMMHHCRVENRGNYSEADGSPVLSIMSSGVESGGFGVGLTFASQAKVIWAAAFGVTPTFSDAILRNKSWTAAEVFTVDWSTRTSRFIRSHGEGSIARPSLGSSGLPPFAVASPGVQRGTFVP
jgi:hypothetical protein